MSYNLLSQNKKVVFIFDNKRVPESHDGPNRFLMHLKDGSVHHFDTIKKGFEIVRGKAPTDEPRQVVLNHPDAVQRPPSTDDGPRTKANPPPGQIVTGYSPKPGGNSGFNFTYGTPENKIEPEED